MRFKKKPVVVEARLYDVSLADEITAWCGGRTAYEMHAEGDVLVLRISTLDGVMTAMPGDWIIKGVRVHGEFYPCKPDIFEATYEPVGESNE